MYMEVIHVIRDAEKNFRITCGRSFAVHQLRAGREADQNAD
jgi:sarcosine oxidase gamma subunit